MKKIIKLSAKLLLLLTFLLPTFSYAANVDWLWSAIWWKNTNISWGSSSISSTVNSVWYRFLSAAKNIFSWVLLIIIVYAWAQLIISLWTDEDAISKSKRILVYSLVWLLFINLPWTIYEAVKWNRTNVSWWIWSSWASDVSSFTSNLFINTDSFWRILNDNIVRFLKIILIWLAIMVIIIAWLKIMTSRGREEEVSKWKEKILWSLVALVFVWFIDAWQRFVYTWNIPDWRDIFETLANLALFLAAPTVVFFLTLAGYYYITAAWDEEKTKKWKSIVANTLIATAILLVSYVFLYDLIRI